MWLWKPALGLPTPTSPQRPDPMMFARPLPYRTRAACRYESRYAILEGVRWGAAMLAPLAVASTRVFVGHLARDLLRSPETAPACTRSQSE